MLITRVPLDPITYFTHPTALWGTYHRFVLYSACIVCIAFFGYPQKAVFEKKTIAHIACQGGGWRRQGEGVHR